VDLHASAFRDLQRLETHGISRQYRFPVVLPPRMAFPLLQLDARSSVYLPHRADSQDYGPIVDYSRSGSSQFQWLLPANRNINAKWIARLSLPFPRSVASYYSRSLSSFFLLIRRTSGCDVHIGHATREMEERPGRDVQDKPGANIIARRS
jgi:hypothetical protein